METPPPRDPLPRCTASGKVGFRKREALARKNWLQKHGRGKDRLRVYQCPQCGLWHLSKVRRFGKVLG